MYKRKNILQLVPTILYFFQAAFAPTSWGVSLHKTVMSCHAVKTEGQRDVHTYKSYIFTARKRSLGQGNIFTSVCQEICSQGAGGVPAPGQGGASSRGMPPPGGCLLPGGGLQANTQRGN